MVEDTGAAPTLKADPLVLVQRDLAHVRSLLSDLGAEDGGFLHGVVASLLNVPTHWFHPAVALLVARGITGRIEGPAIQLAAVVRIVHAASLSHSVSGPSVGTLHKADAGLVDAEHLTFLAGDYLYAQAAWITAGLRHLPVMALLAETIQGLCRDALAPRDPAPENATSATTVASEHDPYMPRPGLYQFSALGSADLMGCGSGTRAALSRYGRALDRLSAAGNCGSSAATATAQDAHTALNDLDGDAAWQALRSLVPLVAQAGDGTPAQPPTAGA